MPASGSPSPLPAFVALLRAVNVGGRGTLAMADLGRAAEAAGCVAPRTLLQSGNLVFRSEARPAELGPRLEAALAATCGLSTTILVRAAPDWAVLVAGLPFPELAAADPSHVVAMILRDAPDAARRAALQVALHAAIGGREQSLVRGTTAYIAYPDGIGRSKLTPARIEKALGTEATGRNWRTIAKIAEALA